MRHSVEVELGVAEIMTADWSMPDRWGKQEHVQFLTTEGELKEFSTKEEFVKSLPSNSKRYWIGHVNHDQIGRNGHRFETRNTYKVVQVL